ncbi:MAG: succinate dehydrogenase cytochrome b subunit [Deltaproteobacteria bacterium]|nr:succinate dehydrogenase cytochrome b subunit [Deltaproteobacteria bacterium]MBW2064913.1 succinate dehydrogenase cytochrome b subunit [Deltaproteobacteria bacterium]
MNWLFSFFWTSIGKKLIMACTGFVFCVFLIIHFIGNLMIFRGGEVFNAYSERLHSFGLIINAIEIGLLVLAIFHVTFAAILYFENLRARPTRYVLKKNAGGRTWSSRLMPYTGLYLLFFVILHLLTFHFAQRDGRTLYQLVAGAFDSPAYVVFYVFSMIVAGLHIRHGFWSAFQTIGADHPKYTSIIRGGSLILSIVLTVGFSSIPLFILWNTLGD